MKMRLLFESGNNRDYLAELPPIIQFDTPEVKALIEKIKASSKSDYDRARMAFEIARDNIAHNFDTGDPEITITAEDTLVKEKGICFAKSHLLVTLLRGMGIPAGFCYQRVVRKGTPESGHALHGLVAVYFKKGDKWFRLDPRGNKPGIDARFSLDEEKLAYPIRKEFVEIDYPNVFIAPLPSVIEAMEESKDTQELFFKRPEYM